jgi:hypothetical protein
MEDMKVGRVTDQWVYGHGFGERGKIAHGMSTPGRHV